MWLTKNSLRIGQKWLAYDIGSYSRLGAIMPNSIRDRDAFFNSSKIIIFKNNPFLLMWGTKFGGLALVNLRLNALECCQPRLSAILLC